MTTKTAQSTNGSGAHVPTEVDYIRAIAEACPPAVWGQIIGKQVESALNGDTKAAAFLGRYLLKDAPALMSNPVQGKRTKIDDLLDELERA